MRPLRFGTKYDSDLLSDDIELLDSLAFTIRVEPDRYKIALFSVFNFADMSFQPVPPGE